MKIDNKTIENYVIEISEGQSVGDLLQWVEDEYGIMVDCQDYIEFVIDYLEQKIGDMKYEYIIARCVKEIVEFIKFETSKQGY